MTRPRFPLLKTLQVNLRSLKPPPPHLRWDFDDAIKLQYLRAGLGTPTNLSVNWANLVYLQTVVRSGLNQPIGILGTILDEFRLSLSSLSLCVSLRTLDCNLIGSFPVENLQPTIYLRHLENLKITSDNFTCARFLSYLNTPSLKKADFNLSYFNLVLDGVESWTSAFLNLSERSSFNLSEIFIQSVGRQNSYNDEFVDMLRQLAHTSSIELLTLLSAPPDRSPLPGRMMELLTVDPNLSQEDQKEHLPYLTSFWYRGVVSFPIKLIIAMVESRIKLQEKGDCKRAGHFLGPRGEASSLLASALLNALPPLHFDVTYTNPNWIDEQDPQDVQYLGGLLEKISSSERKCRLAPLEESLMRAYGFRDDLFDWGV
ncbi:hypothetical protein JR316_0013019 [Psilocybe cubensis]|uniref:Uncharacterized protein n=2 Tax=Psilocybe cubensis TaxID=181762 RepID=A0ACB8GGP8_PSICU|nr:hypothetical protein JR316_0013019 [Psilocybe cubensis]KAH9474557.1 hypothetical protein JR316_0013019 [Psilocybe cubensis]